MLFPKGQAQHEKKPSSEYSSSAVSSSFVRCRLIRFRASLQRLTGDYDPGDDRYSRWAECSRQGCLSLIRRYSRFRLVSLYGINGFVNKTTIDLAAGQVRNYDNFLAEIFSYSGAGTVNFDSLSLLGGSSNLKFLVSAKSIWTARMDTLRRWSPLAVPWTRFHQR